MQIDLNSDLGEGAADDAEIMPLITSANVACGFHAGDPSLALKTLRLAAEHGIVVGAHPGYADRENFGRRELALDPAQVYADCVYQIGALSGLARMHALRLKYVKPHGGLYHQACREDAYAEAVIAAAQLFGLMVMGLPGSRLAALAAKRCEFVAEGFADRRYRTDGSLVPRGEADAFITDPAEAVFQVEKLIHERGIQTICVHGDNPRAVLFVQVLRKMLLEKNFRIQSFA